MSEPALASRPDDALACTPNPLTSSSSSELNYTPAVPMFTPGAASSSPSSSSSSSSSSTSASFSGGTPAFLGYTPAYGDDPDAGVCRMPPAPTSSSGTPAPARPPPTSTTPSADTSHPADRPGPTGGPGTTTGGTHAERADTPHSATAGAAARRSHAGGGRGQGGRESASEGNTRRQRDRTLRKLALPPAQAARGAARIGREPIFLYVPTRTFSAPRSLDLPLPSPQAKSGSPQQGAAASATDPALARQAYATAAGQSEALFDRILAAAARLAREADGQLQALTDRNESQLGQALARLEEDHTQHLFDAVDQRDAVLERIATRSDILRAYVVEQANGAIGQMSALRLQVLSTADSLEAPIGTAKSALDKAIGAARTASDAAHDSLAKMQLNRMTEFRNSGKFATTEHRGSAMIEAMLEAADQFGAPRITADIDALRNRFNAVLSFAEPTAACGPCEADGKLMSLRAHGESLGVAGPRAVRSARDGALKSIDQTEEQLILSVMESHHQAENGLAERHDQTRQMLIAQSIQATGGLRNDIERTGRQQVQALTGVAATQPAAVTMVYGEVDKASRATPGRAASLAVQSAARIQRNLASVAERHPAGVLAMAEKNRGNRMDKALAGGREQLGMVAGFAQQQQKFIRETFDQVGRSIDETMFDMAGVPSQVGHSCDSILQAARQAITEANKTLPKQIAFIAEKLNDACDGLVPMSPDSPPANPQAGHEPAPQSLVCTAADEPNQSVWNPNAATSSSASTTSAAPGGAAGSSTSASGSGTPAPSPASCGGCDTARTAARDRSAGASGTSSGDAASGGGGNASGTGTGATTPSTGGDADVGVSSSNTDYRSPNAYREHATPIATRPVSAPTVDAFLTLVVSTVENRIGSQVATAHGALPNGRGTDYTALMGVLRALTQKQAAALSEAYQIRYPGADLATEIDTHRFFGTWYGITNTEDYNADAALAALRGNPGDAAIHELRAAFNFSNETDRIFQVMTSMSQDQMRAFVAGHRGELEDLMTQLSDEDQARFRALMDVNTVRARSLGLRTSIDGINQRFAYGNQRDQRGFALGEAIGNVETAQPWALEGASDRVDTYGLEDPDIARHRHEEHWADIQRDFGQLDGVADAIVRDNPSAAVSRPNDPPGAMLLAYASRPLASYNVGAPMQQQGETHEQALERQRQQYAQYGITLGEERTGEYGTYRSATTQLSEYQQLYLEMVVRHGSQSREARGARALAQFRRQDGVPPDYRDVEQSLHSGRADAVEGGNFQHGSPEEAERDRLQTFVMMERLRRRIEGGATGEIDPQQAKASFRGEMEAAYRNRPADLDVALGVIDSDAGNVQAVIDQAIAREDPALLTRYLHRMDSNQIAGLVTEWNRRHPDGPGLYEKLGLFQHHWSVWHASTWTGPAFTGDEANGLEIAMMGVPQNPQQRAEVALRVVNQQVEQAGWLGRLMCSQQYDDLVEQSRRLREVMGVRTSDIDEQGRIRVVDRDGNTIHMNFGADGQFHPAPGHDGTEFEMLLASSRIVADSYANAVDRMAAMMTTIIAVIGAIVLTVVTFGAGASVLVAMAVAAGFGALTIGVNASMRGGRYSRDDLTRDVVAAAIQIATAGLNVGLARGLAAGGKLIQTGAAASRALSMSERLLVTAARNPMVTQMITQGAIGGMSNMASTALDPAMRRRDDYGDEVTHSFLRGFAGGAITAGVAHGLNTGAASLARRFAVNRAITAAMAQGATRAEAIEHAAEAAVRTSGSRFMEIGARGLVGATSATAGRAAEMGFDNLTGRHQHGSDEFYLELRNAFIQNVIQGMGEGAALRGSRAVFASHAEEHAATVASERQTAAEEAGKSFDREMARYGMGPEAPGKTAEARPAAPPVAAGDEHLAVRTADEEGGRRPPAAANDNPGAKPVRARAALADGEILRMGSVAEGSIFIHPESTNLHAANDNFGRLLNADPSREVAIYYNPGTGEYLVIQGGPRSVAMIRPDGEIMGPGVSGVLASALAQRGGHWELRTHFHPNRPGQVGTNMARRLPSGRTGDFGVIEAEARFLALHADGVADRTSRVYFVDEGKLRFTDFSVHIEGGRATYSVSYPDPLTGERVTPPAFRDIAEYHTFFHDKTGIDPVTGRRTQARTADVEPSTLDPARRVGGETARLGDELSARNRTDAEFVASRMGLAEGFEAARAAGQSHESGLDPLLGRIATTNDAHDMVSRMGLVDRPDAMRRLAAVVNDPTLSTAVKEQVLIAVRDATREALVRRGALAPDEPLLLTLHGAPAERARSIREGGINLALLTGGATDDFSLALYLTTGLRNAQTYAGRGEGGGQIFPALLRGRDMGMEVGPQGTRTGSLIDLNAQGAHRAQWEAFVRANMHLLGKAEAMMNTQQAMRLMDLTVQIGREVFAENPANAGKTPSRAEAFALGTEHFYARAPFADLDRFGARGTLFDAFLRHLGETTADPRLAEPHTVLGELGGVLTSGIGHGDQQAIKNQRVADIISEQLGVGRFAPRAEDEGPSSLRVRAVDEPDESPAARVATIDPEVERQLDRSFARMGADADARGVSADRPGQVPQILAEGLQLVNRAIESFTRGGSPEAAQFAELLNAAPNASGRILREIASESFAGRMRNFTDEDVFSVQAEIRAGGWPQADAQRIAEYLLHAAPGTRIHQTLSEAPFVRRLTSSLAEPFAEGRAERAAVRAARDFADRNSPNAQRRNMRRLLDVDTEGVVAMITGDGSWRSKAMRFAMRRLRAGASYREAVADGFLAARILQGGDFENVADRWQQRANAISHQLLAEMIRGRPDALLHLARTSPRQLSEWFADYVLRQKRSAPPVIDADAFARYVENRQISNILPIVSEASSVWSNFARMGLRLLKADAVMRGGANRPGLDLVGYSVPPGSNVRAGDQVRVVVMDDKAYRSTELENVSAMTGLRLPRNLRTSADEIEAGVRALVRLGEHIDNPDIAEYITGARAAARQMRNAARELDEIRRPAGGNLRDRSYLSKVAEVLRRNNIVPVVSSEYGNVRLLAQWLRAQGFVLDDEYAEILARELDRSRRRVSGM